MTSITIKNKKTGKVVSEQGTDSKGGQAAWKKGISLNRLGQQSRAMGAAKYKQSKKK